MTTENQSDAARIEGTVKLFDPGKGFGFVVADDSSEDILLHANDLRNFGQSSVCDGAAIVLVAKFTERGMQAIEILDIKRPPERDGSSGIDDLAQLSEDVYRDTQLQPARVKWFDETKGFGFGNVFGNQENIVIHIEVLRRSGLADLQPGEAVAMRVIDGNRGKMAIEVLGWEFASIG